MGTPSRTAANTRTRDDRPYSDYGYSPTNHAGGKASGELGGLIFRGDIRLPDGANYYADRIELLSLQKPLKASGKLCFARAVQDSSTMIGFFHVPDSVTINLNEPRPRGWPDYVPKNFFGVAIKGPTRKATSSAIRPTGSPATRAAAIPAMRSPIVPASAVPTANRTSGGASSILPRATAAKAR